MEKNKNYILQKKEYNSKLSTIQISKEIHKKVKDYCGREKIKVRDFIENLLVNNFNYICLFDYMRMRSFNYYYFIF